MISVKFKFEDGGLELSVKGHSIPAVCAWVSAITQTAVWGLIKLSEQWPGFITVEGDAPPETRLW